MAIRPRLVRWIQSWSPLTELIVVLTIAFGFFIFQSLANIHSGPRPFWAEGILYFIIVPELVFGGVCIALLHARQKRVRDYGFQPSIAQGLTGVGFFACSWAIWIAALYLVALTQTGWQEPQDPLVIPPIEINAFSIAVMCMLVVINSLFEEFFVTGYLMRSLCDMGRPTLAIGLSVLVRTSYHLYQEPAGWISTAMLGLLFSVYYLARKQLFALVVAHGLINGIGFLLGS